MLAFWSRFWGAVGNLPLQPGACPTARGALRATDRPARMSNLMNTLRSSWKIVAIDERGLIRRLRCERTRTDDGPEIIGVYRLFTGEELTRTDRGRYVDSRGCTYRSDDLLAP